LHQTFFFKDGDDGCDTETQKVLELRFQITQSTTAATATKRERKKEGRRRASQPASQPASEGASSSSARQRAQRIFVFLPLFIFLYFCWLF
jgi:hypothetical protein